MKKAFPYLIISVFFLTLLFFGSTRQVRAVCCDCGWQEDDATGDCNVPNGGCTAQCSPPPPPPDPCDACDRECGPQGGCSSCGSCPGGSCNNGNCSYPPPPPPPPPTGCTTDSECSGCSGVCSGGVSYSGCTITGGSCSKTGCICDGGTCKANCDPSCGGSCGPSCNVTCVACGNSTGCGTCSTGCTPGTSEACGTCGTRTCDSAGNWGTCNSPATCGGCTPGDTRGCNNCGTQTCNSSGAWGTCSGDTNDQQSCGTCGTQNCTASGNWGVCNEPASGCGGQQPKNCSVSGVPSTPQSYGDTNITFTLNGNTQSGSTSQLVQMWLVKQDGSAINPIPPNRLVSTITGANAYKISECSSVNNQPCSNTYNPNSAVYSLPTGTYYVFCSDPDNTPVSKCWGNPFCSNLNSSCSGPLCSTCSGWLSCSNNDWATLTVATPTSTVQGQAFDDANANGCWDTGESVINYTSTGTPISLQGTSVSYGRRDLSAGSYSFPGITMGDTVTIDYTAPYPTGYAAITGFPNVGEIANCSAQPAGFNSKTFTASTNPSVRNIGFTKNVPWFNSVDGDIYSGTGGISSQIPTFRESASTGNKYWMIGKTGNAGGVAISNLGNIIAQQSSGANQISKQPGGLLVGWNIPNANFNLDYFSGISLNTKSTTPCSSVVLGSITLWSLTQNTDCVISSFPTGQINWGSGGVSSVYYTGAADLVIADNIVSSNLAQGLILITPGNVIIRNTVSQINAVIIAGGTITMSPLGGTSTQILTINGGLYAKNGVDMLKRTLSPISPATPNNTVDPAVTINFNPIYLNTRSSSLTKTTVSSWREITPTN